MKNDLYWFKDSNCSSLVIKDYKKASDSNHGLVKPIEIRDPTVITSLLESIQALPVAGEILISFSSNVPYTRLEFHCSNSKEIIEFYRGLIKTPDTSFYAGDKPAANAVYEQVKALLANRKR